MSTAIRRASLPLTEQDIADLAKLRDSRGPWQRRLREHAGAESLSSEAAILHAVLLVGLDRLRDEVLAEGYGALAESYQESGEAAHHAALRRRRRRHHTDAE